MPLAYALVIQESFLIKILPYDAYIVQVCEEETSVFALLHKKSLFFFFFVRQIAATVQTEFDAFER